MDVMNSRRMRSRMANSTEDWIRDRWEIVYSESIGRYGNPEREGWTYVERQDDWFRENDCELCAACSECDTSSEMYGVMIFSRGREIEQRWCGSCGSAETQLCGACEERVRADDLIETGCGDYYCPPCHREHEERLNDEDAGKIREYQSVTRPYAPLNAPAWSMELEMEFPDSSACSAFAIEARNLENWRGTPLILERDGSLSRDKGVECVLSCYQSTEDLLADVHAVQACAKKHKAIAWDLPKIRNADAGLHISTNRIQWTRRALCRLGFILTVCDIALERAAGRRTHYADYPPRAPFGTMPQGNLASFARGSRGKYCAVNVRESRLEWRIFRATLNPERIAKNLSLVNSLEALAKSQIPAAKLKSSALEIIHSHTL